MTKDRVKILLKSEITTDPDPTSPKDKNQNPRGVRAWWDFNKSKALTEADRNRIARVLKSRIAAHGVLAVVYKKHPTFQKNKNEALAIMTRLVVHALKESDQPFKQTRMTIPGDTLMRKRK